MVAAQLPLEDDSGVGGSAVVLTEMVAAQLALQDEALVAEPIPLPQPAMSAAHARRIRNTGSSVGMNAPVTAELLSGRTPRLTPGDTRNVWATGPSSGVCSTSPAHQRRPMSCVLDVARTRHVAPGRSGAPLSGSLSTPSLRRAHPTAWCAWDTLFLPEFLAGTATRRPRPWLSPWARRSGAAALRDAHPVRPHRRLFCAIASPPPFPLRRRLRTQPATAAQAGRRLEGEASVGHNRAAYVPRPSWIREVRFSPV